MRKQKDVFSFAFFLCQCYNDARSRCLDVKRTAKLTLGAILLATVRLMASGRGEGLTKSIAMVLLIDHYEL